VFLTKYRGRHGNKTETYESIADMINDTARLSKVLTRSASVPHRGGQTGVPTSSGQGEAGRCGHGPEPLVQGGSNSFNVAARSEAVAPSLILFGCLLCRSTLFGGSQAVNLVGR
jgi:hypothetical protein